MSYPIPRVSKIASMTSVDEKMFDCVVAICCEVFGVSIDDVFTKRRERKIVFAKAAISNLMYIDYCNKRIALQYIGERMNKDHSMILHYIHKVHEPMIFSGTLGYKESYIECLRRCRMVWNESETMLRARIEDIDNVVISLTAERGVLIDKLQKL